MIIDIERLLQDVSADAPCGEDLSYDSEMLELATAFSGRPAQQIGDAVTEAVEPSWPDVRERSESILKRSHDLRVILHLAVALAETDGLPGLHDGLSLLEQTVARHWAHLYPQLDPEDNNDPLERINIIAGMNIAPATMGDPLQFRTHLQKAALTNSRGFGRVSYRDIQAVKSGEGEARMTSGDIDAAFKDSDLEFLVENHNAAQGAAASVQRLDAKLTELVGSGSATSLDGLLEDLRGIESEMAQRLRERGYGVASAEPAAAAGGEGSAAAAGPAAAALSGEVTSPRDAELALDKVIRYYESHEPSSPVPMLVNVARSMISKSFVEISKALPPDTVELVLRIMTADRSD